MSSGVLPTTGQQTGEKLSRSDQGTFLASLWRYRFPVEKGLLGIRLLIHIGILHPNCSSTRSAPPLTICKHKPSDKPKKNLTINMIVYLALK